MKHIQPIAYLVCAVLLMMTGSRQPGMRPAAAPQNPRFPGELRGNLQQQRANEPVSENEWAEISQWMEIHCPNRMNFFLHRLEDRPIEQEQVKKRIVELYRQLNGIRNDNLLKQAMVTQAEAADKVFGAALNVRATTQQHDARAKLIAERQLEGATGDLVDAEINVRQARIQKLQNEVNDMLKRRQQLVKQRYNQQLNLARNPGAGPRATGDAEGISPEPDKK